MAHDNIHHKPYSNKNSYYGTRYGPITTMNVYNSFGVAVARAIDEDTAALIAAALNEYGGSNVSELLSEAATALEAEGYPHNHKLVGALYDAAYHK